MSTKNILITGSRAPIALEMTRLLGRAGHRVFSADTLSTPLCRYSRYLTAYYRVPSPRYTPLAYIEAIEQICQNQQIDILLPTCEEIFTLSTFKNRLERYCRPLVENFNLLRQLHHKGEFIRLAGSFNLTIPKTHQIESLEQLPSERPLILKPAFSRFGYSVELLLRVDQKPLAAPSAKRPWIAQEYLTGRHWATYSVADRGELMAHCTYPIGVKIGGGATMAFSHHRHAAIEEWVSHFLRSIAFTGQIAFDFIEREDGTLYPLECNPRGTSGLHLFYSRPEFADVLLGESKACIYPHVGAKAQLTLPILVFGLKSLFGKGGWRTLRGREVIFELRDPLPGFAQLLNLSEFVWRSVKSGISLLEATSSDMEYNEE